MFDVKHVLSPPAFSRALQLFVLRTCGDQECTKLLIIRRMYGHLWAVCLWKSISYLSDATVVQQFHSKFLKVFHLHFRRKNAFVFHCDFPPNPLLYSYIFSNCCNMLELGWIFLWAQMSLTNCLNSKVCKPPCSFISFPQALLRQRLVNSHGVVVLSPLCTSTQCCAWTQTEVWVGLSLAESELGNTQWSEEQAWTRRKRMGQRQQRFLEGRWKQFLFFFFFLRESVYLMSQKAVWLPRKAAK